MAITQVFAGIGAADFDSALRWYERFVGRPPDLVPREGDAAWQLSETGWIYVVDDPPRAGTGLLTLLVDDLERYVAELADRGIDAGEIETVPGVVRRAVIADPDGNRITVGEPLG
ncbi:MAG: hypothetical protein QOE06_3470 [Thermoleophilaceae bacterium]|jgi:predicted enzyme related to lactoylglutathione lyase|nr:hypothetical protein [Thermoleophilaceae bacterium]